MPARKRTRTRHGGPHVAAPACALIAGAAALLSHLASCLVPRYFVAVHSGFKELREGITFVIDTTDDSMMSRQGERGVHCSCSAIHLRQQ